MDRLHPGLLQQPGHSQGLRQQDRTQSRTGGLEGDPPVPKGSVLSHSSQGGKTAETVPEDDTTHRYSSENDEGGEALHKGAANLSLLVLWRMS